MLMTLEAAAVAARPSSGFKERLFGVVNGLVSGTKNLIFDTVKGMEKMLSPS